MGSAESFSLGGSTPEVPSKFAFDDSISLGGSSLTERLVLAGITQPDLLAVDFGLNSDFVGV